MLTADPALSGADVVELLARCREEDRVATSRLVSLVSRGTLADAAVVSRVLADHGMTDTMTIGITGPPGVGKSTLTSAIIGELRQRGKRVGVVAVDPSSPVTGGAVLGDRIRMARHVGDAGVFVRSLSSGGHLGGLVRSASLSARVLGACGFDVVLIETVGIGQSEVDIAQIADTVLLVLAPGAGDSIQAQKAGVLEVADLYVVNKADLDGARSTVADLREMLLLGKPGEGWRPYILQTVAGTGQGVSELVEALFDHHSTSAADGELARRHSRRASYETRLVMGSVLAEQLAAVVVGDAADPYAAADVSLRALGRRIAADGAGAGCR
jgi:LAO/AO transport system kinase